jgi:hypothetical protein
LPVSAQSCVPALEFRPVILAFTIFRAQKMPHQNSMFDAGNLRFQQWRSQIQQAGRRGLALPSARRAMHVAGRTVHVLGGRCTRFDLHETGGSQRSSPPAAISSPVSTRRPPAVKSSRYLRMTFSPGAASSLSVVGIGTTFAVRLTVAILRTSRQWSWQLMQVLSVFMYANVAASACD